MITITKTIKLQDFEAWSGGQQTLSYLTENEIELVEEMIIEGYPDGLSEGDLNDILWHERDMIAQWLNFNDFDEIINR